MTIIVIDTIEHNKQRYPTVGDWQFVDDLNALHINVSNMNNPDYEFLVAIHEVIEAWLCRKHGITDEQVTKFDKLYESKRRIDDLISEPGDSIQAPYHKEHVFATKIEIAIAIELGVDWNEYEKTVQTL